MAAIARKWPLTSAWSDLVIVTIASGIVTPWLARPPSSPYPYTEFLEQSLAARGHDPYWDGDGFVSPGDAYDGIPDPLTTSDLGLEET